MTTNSKAREEELIQTKERLTRYIFHELRTPLNSVSMGLELLVTERNQLSPESMETLDMIVRSVINTYVVIRTYIFTYKLSLVLSCFFLPILVCLAFFLSISSPSTLYPLSYVIF